MAPQAPETPLPAWATILNMVDYYNLLGIPPDAPPEAVRRAFRARAKAVHPDAHPLGSPGEHEALKRRFIQLAQAYETLSDPARRARYDRQRNAAASQGRGTERGQEHARDSARSRPGWRDTRSTFGRARREAERDARTAGAAGADEGLDDLLRDVETLLGRFGLSVRQPFEELLEALLDWARGVFRQVAEAWDGGAADAAEETPPSGGRTAHEAARGTSGSTRAGAGPSRERARAAPGEQARAEAAALQAELDAIKRRVRRQGPTARAGAPSVEEELRRLKERLGKAD